MYASLVSFYAPYKFDEELAKFKNFKQQYIMDFRASAADQSMSSSSSYLFENTPFVKIENISTSDFLEVSGENSLARTLPVDKNNKIVQHISGNNKLYFTNYIDMIVENKSDTKSIDVTVNILPSIYIITSDGTITGYSISLEKQINYWESQNPEKALKNSDIYGSNLPLKGYALAQSPVSGNFQIDTSNIVTVDFETNRVSPSRSGVIVYFLKNPTSNSNVNYFLKNASKLNFYTQGASKTTTSLSTPVPSVNISNNVSTGGTTGGSTGGSTGGTTGGSTGGTTGGMIGNGSTTGSGTTNTTVSSYNLNPSQVRPIFNSNPLNGLVSEASTISKVYYTSYGTKSIQGFGTPGAVVLLYTSEYAFTLPVDTVTGIWSLTSLPDLLVNEINAGTIRIREFYLNSSTAVIGSDYFDFNGPVTQTEGSNFSMYSGCFVRLSKEGGNNVTYTGINQAYYFSAPSSSFGEYNLLRTPDGVLKIGTYNSGNGDISYLNGLINFKDRYSGARIESFKLSLNPSKIQPIRPTIEPLYRYTGSSINTYIVSPTKNTFLALFFRDGSTVKSNIYIEGDSRYVFSNPGIVIEFDTIGIVYKDTDYDSIVQRGPRSLPIITKYTSEVIPDIGLKV